MMLTTGELRTGDRFTVGGVMRTVVQTEVHDDGMVSVHYRPSVGLMHVKPTIKIEEVDTSGREIGGNVVAANHTRMIANGEWSGYIEAVKAMLS